MSTEKGDTRRGEKKRETSALLGAEAAGGVVLYGTRWCGYCRAAEALLEERGISFQRIDVRGDPDMRRWLRETTQRHTVPQIFIDGRPIGGYAALARLDSSGELEALLDRPDPRAASAGE